MLARSLMKINFGFQNYSVIFATEIKTNTIMIRADRWAILYSYQILENGEWIEEQKYQCFSWLLPAIMYCIECKLDTSDAFCNMIRKPRVKLFYKK